MPNEETEVVISNPETNDSRNTVYVLEYGSKRLTLEITPEGFSEAYLKKISDDPKDHREGETTILHKSAYTILRKEASRSGIDISFDLRTLYPNIIKWAETEGNKIFHWYSSGGIDDFDRVVFHARIRNPKSNTLLE